MVDLPSSEDCAEILKKKMDKAGVEFSEKQWNTIIDKFTLYSGSGTVIFVTSERSRARQLTPKIQIPLFRYRQRRNGVFDASNRRSDHV